MKTPTPWYCPRCLAAHAAALSLDVPGARLRISTQSLEGPKALVYFGGNAEDVAYTLPEFAAAFPDRALYLLHDRGYSGSTGRPAEAALRSDARAVFRFAHKRRTATSWRRASFCPAWASSSFCRSSGSDCLCPWLILQSDSG